MTEKGKIMLLIKHGIELSSLLWINVKKFYSQNTNLLLLKPKSSFRHLKQGIQEFHGKYVLVPSRQGRKQVIRNYETVYETSNKNVFGK